MKPLVKNFIVYLLIARLALSLLSTVQSYFLIQAHSIDDYYAFFAYHFGVQAASILEAMDFLTYILLGFLIILAAIGSATKKKAISGVAGIIEGAVDVISGIIVGAALGSSSMASFSMVLAYLFDIVLIILGIRLIAQKDLTEPVATDHPAWNKQMICPACHQSYNLSQIRNRTQEQLLTGGWSCPLCGVALNREGMALISSGVGGSSIMQQSLSTDHLAEEFGSWSIEEKAVSPASSKIIFY